MWYSPIQPHCRFLLLIRVRPKLEDPRRWRDWISTVLGVGGLGERFGCGKIPKRPASENAHGPSNPRSLPVLSRGRVHPDNETPSFCADRDDFYRNGAQPALSLKFDY